MTDLYTVAQMREAEMRAETEYGIPLATLMDNAGGKLAENAMEMSPPGGHIGIFCGKGNNGGDGYVCAAILLNQGFQVSVWGVSRDDLLEGTLTGNAASVFETAGGSIYPLTSDLDISGFDFHLVIDALLGTGLDRPVSALYAHGVALINSSTVPVLSCDLPSGVNADTGEIMGTAVRATRTLMLGLAKYACTLSPGSECFGEQKLADIGLEVNLQEESPL